MACAVKTKNGSFWDKVPYDVLRIVLQFCTQRQRNSYESVCKEFLRATRSIKVNAQSFDEIFPSLSDSKFDLVKQIVRFPESFSKECHMDYFSKYSGIRELSLFNPWGWKADGSYCNHCAHILSLILPQLRNLRILSIDASWKPDTDTRTRDSDSQLHMSHNKLEKNYKESIAQRQNSLLYTLGHALQDVIMPSLEVIRFERHLPIYTEKEQVVWSKFLTENKSIKKLVLRNQEHSVSRAGIGHDFVVCQTMIKNSNISSFEFDRFCFSDGNRLQTILEFRNPRHVSSITFRSCENAPPQNMEIAAKVSLIGNFRVDPLMWPFI